MTIFHGRTAGGRSAISMTTPINVNPSSPGATDMKRTLIASLLALLGLNAAAAPEYAGHLGLNPGAYSLTHIFNDADQVMLDHAFVFLLDRPHDLVGRAGVLTSGDGFEAVGAMLSLWHSNGDMDFSNDTLLGGFDFGTTLVEQSFAAVQGGEYFWRLEAMVTGVYGEIAFEVDHLPTSAVPEPSTAAMLSVALLAMGAVARSRRPR
jgi:hypothetical protein